MDFKKREGKRRELEKLANLPIAKEMTFGVAEAQHNKCTTIPI